MTAVVIAGNVAPIFKADLHLFSAVHPQYRNTSSHLDVQATILRRVDEPTTGKQEKRRPPMFPNPGCFWCPTETELKAKPEVLLAMFTTAKFTQVTRARAQDLVIDTCLFYTQVVNPPPTKLSRLATDLACQYKKILDMG